MTSSWLLSGKRTPIGSDISESCLTILHRNWLAMRYKRARRAKLHAAALEPAQIDEVIMGQVLSAGVGQALRAQASLLAGIRTLSARDSKQSMWIGSVRSHAGRPGDSMRRSSIGCRRWHGEHECASSVKELPRRLEVRFSTASGCRRMGWPDMPTRQSAHG